MNNVQKYFITILCLMIVIYFLFFIFTSIDTQAICCEDGSSCILPSAVSSYGLASSTIGEKATSKLKLQQYENYH